MIGAAGSLGRVLRPRLKAMCDVRCAMCNVQCAMCNVPRVSDSAEMASAEPGEAVVVAPLQDKAVVLAQLRGIAAAVHLGAIATEGAFDAILPAEHLRHPSPP